MKPTANTLSIIIPVFNKAGYVARCLQSVLEQDYTDFELIIIDDGSTDESASIIQQFTDPRITLISTANQGVSAARNRGIAKASGEYLLFIDADDYISPFYLSHIMQACAAQEADLYVWGITKDYADGRKIAKVPEKQGLLQANDFLHEMVEEQYHRHVGIMGYIPNKLIKRDLVMSHGIRFDTQKKLLEDYDFFLSYYAHVQTAYFFDERGYHYVGHPATPGVTRKVDYLSLIDIHRRCMLLSSKSADSSHDYSLVLKAIGQLTLAMFLEMHPVSFKEASQKMSEIFHRPFCENGLRLIRPKQRKLRWLLLSRSKRAVFVYLKCRQAYMKTRNRVKQ